jgi:hypothetical protein
MAVPRDAPLDQSLFYHVHEYFSTSGDFKIFPVGIIKKDYRKTANASPTITPQPSGNTNSGLISNSAIRSGHWQAS